MTTPNLEQLIAEPDEADIDASLALDGFDASERYPEHGHDALRVAYRSGWSDSVAAIRDSGLTVIALPEADDADDDGSEWWVRKDSIVAEDGGVSLFAGSTEPMGADNAAELGAAILAAAQVAERNNHE